MKLSQAQQEFKLLELLNTVKISKKTGPDGISNRILKIAPPFIRKNLTDIFNLSIVSGIFTLIGKLPKGHHFLNLVEEMNPTIIQAYNCLTNYSRTCLKKQWTEFVATSLDDSTKEMTSWLLQVVGKSTMKHWRRYLTELNILESHLTRPSAYFSSPKLLFMATNLTKKVSDLQQRRCKPFTNVHSQSPKLKWAVSWVWPFPFPSSYSDMPYSWNHWGSWHGKKSSTTGDPNR